MSDQSYFSEVIQYINKLQADYYKTPLDQLNELGLLGRIKLYDWHLEFIGLGLILTIILLFQIGAYLNQSKVSKILKSLTPLLDENFHQVGISDEKLFIKDSIQSFTSYATGRINISNLKINFKLAPRQNLIQYLLESIIGIFFPDWIEIPSDSIEIIIKPLNKIQPFIFAIVNKEGMNKFRDDNYFLSLTKISETIFSNNYVFMSESNELNENLINKDLIKILSDNSTDKILKYLAITDLPSNKPIKESDFTNDNNQLILKLNLLTDSKSLSIINSLVDQLIKLSDQLIKFQLKLDQQKKINNVRSNELIKLQKIIQDLKDEELKEQKLEIEKQIKKNSKLSPDELDKLEKRQKEKKERRQRNKLTKREVKVEVYEISKDLVKADEDEDAEFDKVDVTWTVDTALDPFVVTLVVPLGITTKVEPLDVKVEAPETGDEAGDPDEDGATVEVT
ncbi:hypothetical protein WICMUC_004768 [Wickerhamomyces mucosus]|uniref:Uncharacterized protein n=1 Tax=Wickerhamomyces mucosus TaxID=1378264 RepID=A0A9P8PH53_9ASCO|nr:hypothetical protein WICMUC_004768 [Wickerhamomyces mucosus]